MFENQKKRENMEIWK